MRFFKKKKNSPFTLLLSSPYQVHFMSFFYNNFLLDLIEEQIGFLNWTFRIIYQLGASKLDHDNELKSYLEGR